MTIESEELDSAGRTVDFGVMKERIGGWVDAHLDHAYISQRDDAVGLYLDQGGHKVHWMPNGWEPTAECLARHLYEVSVDLISDWCAEDPVRFGLALRVVEVKCHETPNCWASYPVS